MSEKGRECGNGQYVSESEGEHAQPVILIVKNVQTVSENERENAQYVSERECKYT